MIRRALAVGLLVVVGWGWVAGALPPRVVISEVAWMGTRASPADEWIELFNPGSEAVDLSGWTLRWRDHRVSLEGTLPAGGVFLLERTDDASVSDVKADLIYTGGLRNGGESLTLLDPQGEQVDSANGDGGPWPAGDNATKATMQRLDPLAPDEDSNWKTCDRPAGGHRDSQGQPIWGSPHQVEGAATPASLGFPAPAPRPLEEAPAGSARPDSPADSPPPPSWRLWLVLGGAAVVLFLLGVKWLR